MSEKFIINFDNDKSITAKINSSNKIIVKTNNDNNIFVKFNPENKIICSINNKASIKVNFGSQGLRGYGGLNSNHALLSNLDYAQSGHTGFQKKLIYISEYKAYEIDDN